MTHPDPDVADAMARLSVPDRSPYQLSRRRFLQAAALAGGAAYTLGAFSRHTPFAGAAPGDPDGILVLINLNGGNDGLNMVVPIDNPVYYALRPTIALAPAATLPLGGGFGLHPRLPYLKQLWDAKQLAVVHGVGYPNFNRSHFESMRIWQEGWAGSASATSGWLGRYLDTLGPAAGPVPVTTISDDVPYHLVGANTRAVALGGSGAFFGTDLGSRERRIYDAMRAMAAQPSGLGQWADLYATTARQLIDVGATVAPAYNGSFPDAWFSREMVVAARLLNANVGVRVINLNHDGGWDTHSDELPTHNANFRRLDDGIRAFYGALDPAVAAKVVIAVVSEFGRQLDEDGDAGTDHGTSNPVLVIGQPVKGGFYGALPSFTDLLSEGMLNFSVDFRSIYTSILANVLGGDPVALLGGTFPDLGFVARVGGTPVPTTTTTAAATTTTTVAPTTTTVVATTTTTAATTTTTVAATTTAATTTPTTAATTTSTTEAATTTAATTTPTTAPTTTAATTTPTTAATTTSTTEAPTTTVAPTTSTTAPSTGGDAGASCSFNEPGSFVALDPVRILDTRSGRGLPRGGKRKLGPGETIDVRVTGKGRIPGPDVTAVLLNVTALRPTATGFLAVWPDGDPQPDSANLSFQPDAPSSNLVIVKVSGKGLVKLFNSAGQTHVVADVMGYFTTEPGSNLRPIRPQRVLDTRQGHQPLITGHEHVLRLTGAGAVPADGVRAVLLNMTVTEPLAGGELCVWARGAAKPDVAMVSYTRGQTVPNLVVAPVNGDGEVTVQSTGGAAHVIADVVGYFSPSCAVARMVAVSPTRVLDTRRIGRTLSSANMVELPLAGVGGVPATGATAVVLNVTAARPTRAGYLTVWPATEPQPPASNLNFTPRHTVPNLVVAELGSNGAVNVAVSAGRVHVMIDLVGYFVA